MFNKFLSIHLFTGERAIVQVLLENGADIKALNKNGETPLDIAGKKLNKQIADMIKEYDTNDLERSYLSLIAKI